MDTVDPLRVLISLAFVVGLIGMLAMVLKRVAASKSWPLKGMTTDPEKARLHVVETRFLDPRRKLVLVRRDNVEHLLLLADGREQVIESSIIPAAADEAEHA